jgi:hypothetical protein
MLSLTESFSLTGEKRLVSPGRQVLNPSDGGRPRHATPFTRKEARDQRCAVAAATRLRSAPDARHPPFIAMKQEHDGRRGRTSRGKVSYCQTLTITVTTSAPAGFSLRS